MRLRQCECMNPEENIVLWLPMMLLYLYCCSSHCLTFLIIESKHQPNDPSFRILSDLASSTALHFESTWILSSKDEETYSYVCLFTMATENGEKYMLYHYSPRLAPAVIFITLFAISSIVHIWQLWRRRTWYFIPFVIGGLCKFWCPVDINRGSFVYISDLLPQLKQ